jgi:hypothetical protein
MFALSMVRSKIFTRWKLIIRLVYDTMYFCKWLPSVSEEPAAYIFGMDLYSEDETSATIVTLFQTTPCHESEDLSLNTD